MSTPSTEQDQRETTGDEEPGGYLELRLTRLQQEDYVMPGWQTVWNGLDNCTMVTFQPVHQAVPETMAETEFHMWLRGWDARREAVMKRRPRTQTIR